MGAVIIVIELLTGDDDLRIHIDIDKHSPEKFMYMSLTNNFFNNPEKCLKVEVKQVDTAEEVIEGDYRLIVDQYNLQVPKSLIV